MKNFPLVLDGDAFLVYQGLAAADRKTQDEVTKLMKTAFNMTETKAYQAFVTRRLKSDESVDAFVADLKRLSALSGHAVADDKDSVVIQQLLNDLSVDFGRQLRRSMAGKELTISGCCATVRALRTSEEDSQTRSAPVAAVIDPGSSSPKPRSLSCFKCGEVGHIRRNCPQRSGGSGRERQSQQQRPGGSRKHMVCYFCDEEGHTKPDCQQRKN